MQFDMAQAPVPHNNETTPDFPPGLTFAALDDSALVRFNLDRVFKTYFNAGPESFTCGAVRAECDEFISRILSKQVQVAIIDENLEYDDETMFGHNLGRLSRERGFRGCLILHTAQMQTSFPKEFLEPFDGYVEKTAQRKVFVDGVNAAWKHFLASTSV
jgi:hypothetical protein